MLETNDNFETHTVTAENLPDIDSELEEIRKSPRKKSFEDMNESR